jgi:predicted metal-dependent peptidase
MDKQEERLRKSHVFLLKHPKTMQLGGIILLGQSSVEDDVPTAYTDGLNKRYGRKFMEKCVDAQINGLVLHENGHVFFRHVTHHKRIFRENRKLANIAADFVVNDMIDVIGDPLIQLPPGALWNVKFRNWSVIQVYDFLNKRKKELDKQQPKPCDNGNPDNQDKGWSLLQTQSRRTKFAWCGGTAKCMVNNCLLGTMQGLSTCSNPWVAGELGFHLSVNT